jgi:hypothetical protein
MNCFMYQTAIKPWWITCLHACVCMWSHSNNRTDRTEGKCEWQTGDKVLSSGLQGWVWGFTLEADLLKHLLKTPSRMSVRSGTVLNWLISFYNAGHLWWGWRIFVPIMWRKVALLWLALQRLLAVYSLLSLVKSASRNICTIVANSGT